MNFEYDGIKSILNQHKHGISLEDAKVLWAVPHIQLAARMLGEPRLMVVGKLNAKFYSCIFVFRGEKIRLISARRSRANEEREYHEKNAEEDADGQGV